MPQTNVIAFKRNIYSDRTIHRRLLRSSYRVSAALRAEGLVHLDHDVEREFHRAVREAVHFTPQTQRLSALWFVLWPSLAVITIATTAVVVAGQILKALGAI